MCMTRGIMHACHVGDTWHACMHAMQIGPVYKNGPVEEKRKNGNERGKRMSVVQ